ncbi:MAG: hypothetical protein QOJ65_688 [Fimbriimonadaceae bacterium]|jgi:hypothetical protein|nr:hypothetical protein [Fimbriimonadaceae bacterium]
MATFEDRISVWSHLWFAGAVASLFMWMELVGIVLEPPVSRRVNARSAQHNASRRTAWSVQSLAGTYSEGPMLQSLWLNAEGGFRTWPALSVGFIAESGTAWRKGEFLVLEQTMPPRRVGTRVRYYHRYYPVTWGVHTYLVSEDAMTMFCSSIAKGWNGIEHGSSLFVLCHLRKGLPKGVARTAPRGTPEVPTVFIPLLQAPFRAHVVKRTAEIITLDRGAGDGLTLGTALRSPGSRHASAEVVDVHSAWARARYWASDSSAFPVGCEVTTLG